MASAIIPTCDPSRQSCLYTESYFTADTPESDSSSDAICIDPRDKALETIKHTFEELTETVANSPFTRSTISYFRDVASAASAFDAKPTESRAITNWADASIEDIQSYAFAHHQMTLKSEMDKIDRQFAKETDTLTRVTEPGTAYPLATHSQYLPKAVLEQIAPIARMNPNMINEVAFTWAWDGDQPQIYLFRPTAPNGAESGVVFNDETGEVFIFQSEGDRNLYNLPGNSIGNGDPLDILLGQGSRIAGNTISFLEGDDPTKIVFTDQNDSKKSGNPLLGEGSLAAGGMFLLGSLRPGGVGGGGPGGIKPKLPVQGMLIQGGIGTGIFLGIHYGVLALGVPEEIAHYVDVPVMMGAFNLVDQGSAMLANRGILSNRVFPGGINWGSVAHATPFVIWGSVGSSYLMDSLGFEHGTAGNLIGTIGLTTTGYVGISQTTGLLSQAAAPTAEFAAAHPHVIEVAKHFPKTTAAFSNLGAAYATTRGIGLVPATVNIGSKTLTLGTVGAGGSTGVYIAGGGFAGGGGVLAGGLQAVGAAGVVALGSWVGGGIVDIWAWASGRSKDPDYQLIDFTWNYINTEATCGLVNSIFGPLMKGIEAIFMNDTMYEAMEMTWELWSGSINLWSTNIDETLVTLALGSFNGSGFDTETPKVSMYYDVFEDAAESVLQGDTKPKKCSGDDDGDDCKTNAEITEAVVGMLGRLEDTFLKYELDENAKELGTIIRKNGAIGSEWGMKNYIRGLLKRYQERGLLKHYIKKSLTNLRQHYNDRMVDMGLMYWDGKKSLPIHVEPGTLTDEQIKFLFGDRDHYKMIATGQLTDISQIKSESVMLKSRLTALEYLLKKIESGNEKEVTAIIDRIF